MTLSPDPSVSERLTELREFLAGSGVIDGAWFGEFKPGERVPFWWRKRMRADLTEALALLDTQAAEIERLKAGLDREAVIKIISETAIGIRFSDLMASKREWVTLHGEKNGYWRDVNDPFQSDVIEAADAILALPVPPSDEVKS